MSEKTRVLVIDDEESIRTTFSLILGDEGYIVDTAENGKDALDKASSNFYNVIISDMRLPDIEGVKLLSLMKETTPKTRKLIMTGYPTMQNAVESVNTGVDAYLLKPLDMDGCSSRSKCS